MDHLPLPEETAPFIVAPYEAPEALWYDNAGFLTFPQRRGWTEEQLRGGDDLSKDDSEDKNGFHSKGTSYEVEQFFQTWLFFGLAIEVMKIGGVHVTTEDFLKPKGEIKARIVDTSKLPSLYLQWKEGILNSGQDLEEVWETLNEMFQKTATVLDRFCAHENDLDTRPLSLEKPRPWPVRDEISTTMIALAFSLRRAAIDVCDMAGNLNGLSLWPQAQSKILTRRIRQKWCIADTATILKQLSIDGQYYMAGAPGLQLDELDHHSNCTKRHCLYDYDPNFYTTKHAGAPYHKTGCRVEIPYGGQLGPERGQKDWVDAIHRIIDKGAIPIALWVKGLKRLWSVEYHFSGQRKPDYVAISHVWSDGKGNPNSNSLPECQLDRITRLVEKVTWEGRKEVPSNPNESDGVGFWMDTLCVPAKDKVRKGKAILTMRHVYKNAKAVLVLDDWLEQLRSDAPVLSIVARLYQSNWIKRLWTHQEGFFPPSVWIQFSDRSVELSELSKKVDDYQSSLRATGTHISFPDSAGLRFLTLYTFVTEGFKAMSEEDDKWILYRPLANAMAERKTSRLADETICLATLIGIDVQQFLDLPDKPDEESAKKRMSLFLRVLGRFETSIIFNNYERLTERGYGWAPKSLLNIRDAEMGNTSDENDESESDFAAVNGELGLLVHYPGFLVNFAHGKPSFATVERSCAIRCQGTTESGMEYNGQWFVIELSVNRVDWSTRKTYAIVLSSIPSAYGQRCQVAVAWSRSGAVNGIYTVQHQAVGTVQLRDTAPSWIDTAEAPLLPKETSWHFV